MSRILLFVSLIWYVCSKVTVFSPKELIEKVKLEKGTKDNFETSLANFGIIPYGHSLIGKLYFDPENPNGCRKFDDFQFTEEDSKDQQSPIILVYRGECTFVKKVRNVEHAGGRLAIVIDKKIDEISSVIMSDDGTGMSVNIPSFIIGKSDGEILINYITDNGKLIPVKEVKPNESSTDPKTNSTTTNDDKDKKKEPVENEKEKKEPVEKEKEKKKGRVSDLFKSASLYVNFELPNPDQRVEYDIWYSSIDNRALDFITDFQKYDERFDNMVLMAPHFVTWK